MTLFTKMHRLLTGSRPGRDTLQRRALPAYHTLCFDHDIRPVAGLPLLEEAEMRLSALAARMQDDLREVERLRGLVADLAARKRGEDVA